MGSRGQPASPILESGQRPMAPTGMGGERWQAVEGTPLRLWEWSGDRKSPRLKRMRAGRGGAGFGNSGPWTRISKQLIGGNADELRKRTENGGRRLGRESPLAPSPPIPAPIGRRGRWRGGGGGSPNWGTTSHGRIPPQNDQPKAQNFGGKSPPKVCAFSWWPFRLIGELADGRGGMAPVFQSAADPSDRCRLKIPRAFSDSGRPPPSVGRVECAERRTPAERRGGAGRGGRGGQ